MEILLKDALREMESTDERGRPQPFDVLFCTCNEAEDTGGEAIELKGWVLLKHAKAAQEQAAGHTPNVRRSTTPRPPSEAGDQMRKFYNPANGEIRQAHIRLIEKFNGQPIIW